MSAVPYTFANASGQVPASELDVNFANVKAAVDTAGIVTTNAQPNITSVGTLTALSVTGNVASGNVLTTGRVSATGNVSGTYIFGNGSQLTGIVATSTYGNANVVTLLANFGSNTISTAGNVASGNVSAVGNVTGGNIRTTGAVVADTLYVNQTANFWGISGNTITAPSGATWTSSPAFKDEYITSAANGYINLTSLYANSNTASQVHLEHGLAQIIVDNGSEYIWAFNDSGNLSAPGNVSAVGNVTGGNIRTAGAVVADTLYVNQTANFWGISGNTITAPSGAFWTSNPEFLDEYITSAANGYINLTSLYANSNVASQVHLEHGLAQIIVDNGSEYIWAFDDSGELTAPGNVSAVGDITGNNISATTAFQLPVYANITVRDAAISSPAIGMLVVVGNIYQGYDGSAWGNITLT